MSEISSSFSKTSSSTSGTLGTKIIGAEEPEFNGFKDPFNFQTCVAVSLSFGVLVFILSIYPSLPTSLLTFATMYACYTWFRLYGINMTRKEVIFFVVRNLLEIAPSFEYESVRVSEDCCTPGDGTAAKSPTGPQSLWDALFADEGKVKMAQFYKDHYGPVYRKGKREYREYEKQKEAENAKDSRLPPA